MKYKRVVLAAMAAVAVVSFADPVAAQSTLQAAVAGWFTDAMDWITNNPDTIGEVVYEVGYTVGIL